MDEEVAAPIVPEGLELDRWHGQPYASIVGLCMSNVRVMGVPSPIREYAEVNTRLYVRQRMPAEPRPGVVFVRQLVPHRTTAAVARIFAREPFAAGSVQSYVSEHRDAAGAEVNRIRYEWVVGGEEASFDVESHRTGAIPDQDSLEWFLTHRLWGYNGKPGRPTKAYWVDRPDWQVTEASSVTCSLKEEAVAALGINGVDTASAIMCDGSYARVSWPRRM